MLTIDGISIAFGLQWQVLLRQGSEEAVARKAGATMLWADSAGQYVGLLPPKAKRPGKRTTVYAGAQLVLRATTAQNLVYVSEMPGQDGYVAVGIHHRRPRQGFDHVFLRAAEVRTLLDAFAKVCGSESFSLIGDARLDGIEPLPLTALAAVADAGAIMRRPKLRVTPIQGAAVLVLLGGIGFAWQTYSKWRATQLAEEAVRKTQTPAEQYAQALSVVSASPLFLATGIDDYLDWARELPVSIGGWGVRSVDCEPKDTPRLSCSVRLERNFAQASNESFLAAAPTEWAKAAAFDLDQRTVRVTTTVPLASTRTVGEVLKQARARSELTQEFIPILQKMAVLGTEPKMGNIKPFGLPDGVPEDAVPVLYREAGWSVQVPLRTAAVLKTFPEYAYLTSLSLSLERNGKAGTAESFATVKVAGAVLTK
ncbi:hypothetical protein UB46_29290 [Burkholderiaceae bacterium 16]|nr:hypothetical protein UB46_29290 [Burkholderiaceae bacterium 16]